MREREHIHVATKEKLVVAALVVLLVIIAAQKAQQVLLIVQQILVQYQGVCILDLRVIILLLHAMTIAA